LKTQKVPILIGILCLALVIAVMPLTSACAPKEAPTPAPAPAAKPTVLKFHSYTPPTGIGGMSCQWFMDEVTKRTDGAITWETFWSSALAEPSGQLDLIEKGAVDIEKTCTLYFPGKFPIGHFEYSFPFPPTDAVLVSDAKRQIYEEFPEKEAEYNRYNTTMLANHICAYYDVFGKKPLRTLEDWKGKKIAVIGRYFGRWLEAADVVPVVAPAAERYTMLQTGVIDGSLLWLDLSYSMSHHEQAEYLIFAGFGSFVAEDVMMNLDSFNKLSPEVQNVLREVGLESERYQAEYLKTNLDKLVDILEDEGLEIIRMSDADRARWSDLMEDIPAEWAAEAEAAGAPGWEIAKRWQEITTEMGYKWPRQWAVK